MKPIRVQLGVRVEAISYQVCAFHFFPNELFYHFKYASHQPQKFFNFNLNKLMGRPDHITFHKDGTVHLRLKGDNVILLKGKAPDGIFIPKNNEVITPLLIHSIYSDGKGYSLPLMDNYEDKVNKEVTQLRHTLKLSSGFSIIPFLCHKTLDFNEWLKSTNTRISRSIESLSGRVENFNFLDDFVMHYIITKFVLPRPDFPQEITNCFAYCDLEGPLNNMI